MPRIPPVNSQGKQARLFTAAVPCSTSLPTLQITVLKYGFELLEQLSTDDKGPLMGLMAYTRELANAVGNTSGASAASRAAAARAAAPANSPPRLEREAIAWLEGALVAAVGRVKAAAGQLELLPRGQDMLPLLLTYASAVLKVCGVGVGALWCGLVAAAVPARLP